MTKKSFIALALAVLISAGSYAVADNTYPEKGLWWDPQASGRGYFINRHEDSMFITTFHYGVDGEAEWLSSLGQYVASEEDGIMGVFEGPVFHNSDGQCIACDYVEPITNESVQGPMTITFSDYRNAVFEWQGETILINKYAWTDAIDELKGNWLLTLSEADIQTSQLVNIEDVGPGDIAEIRNIFSDALVGTVLMVDAEPVLTLEQASEPELPIVQPTGERFYAGYSSDEALQVVAVRLDDLPFYSNPDTNTGTMGSTLGVLCDYIDSTSNNQASLTYTSTSQWSCTDTARVLVANGIPDHAVGTFPNANNPNTIAEQSVSASFTLEPVETSSATELGGPRGATGYVLNGVKIDADTAGSCDDSGTSCSLIGNTGNWSIEALGQTSFNFGTDDNNAHVQPGGVYHYHGMPEGFIEKRGGNSTNMTLIAWAADGFPIYARYGYSIADDANSALKSMSGSYQLVSNVSNSRPSTSTYPLGTFSQDWEYVEDSGDLDECNGRVGVTPEFPGGIYHYYATDSYPYFQRCVNGL